MRISAEWTNSFGKVVENSKKRMRWAEFIWAGITFVLFIVMLFKGIH